MAVSVVIPTYKASGFIGETLASVLAQTQLPSEVIVVDDCSPDDTVAVVKQFAVTAAIPIRVIRLTNNSGGPAHPLNIGIRAAKGDLIAPLDHDDTMNPEKLERQVLAFTSEQALVFHRCTPIGDIVSPDFMKYQAEVETWLRAVPRQIVQNTCECIGQSHAYAGLLPVNYCMTCSAMMFRKAVWRQVGGFERFFRLSCDYAFLQRVSRRWNIGFIDCSLVRWRRSASCLTSAAQNYQSCCEIWRIMQRFDRNVLKTTEAQSLNERTGHYEEMLFGFAYKLREAGKTAESLRVYKILLRHRPKIRYTLGAAKACLQLLTASSTKSP